MAWGRKPTSQGVIEEAWLSQRPDRNVAVRIALSLRELLPSFSTGFGVPSERAVMEMCRNLRGGRQPLCRRRANSNF